MPAPRWPGWRPVLWYGAVVLGLVVVDLVLVWLRGRHP